MALQVKAVLLVQGSRDFRVQAVQLVTVGPTENNAPPLVTPQTTPMISPVPATNWSDS